MKKLLQKKAINCILLFTLFLVTINSWGQVVISQQDTAYNTSFNGWNGTMPTGFALSGASAATTYRGTSASSTGGVYAISNSGIGYLPSSSASSLSITGTFKNTTGATITKLELSYKAFSINTNTRTPGWAVTSSLGSVTGLNWTYNAANTASSPANKTVTLTLSTPVANNGTFTLVFSSDRGGGSGSSPMIGIKDVSVKAIPTNVAPSLGGTSTSVSVNYGSTGSLAFTSSGTPTPTFSLSPTPSTATTEVPDGITLGTNVVNVANNVPVGTYYIRITASSTAGSATRDIIVTVNAITPIVTTTTFNNQDDATANTANLKGGVTNNGGDEISQKGFVWNTSNASLNVGDETTVVDADDTDAAFTSAISGLSPNTRYYYRAFATNSANTGYGATNNFYTEAATPGTPALSNATTTTLTLTNDANGNPEATEYVVRVVYAGNTRYLGSDGQLQSQPQWLSGTYLASAVVMTNLTAGTLYTVDVKARNIVLIETPWSSTTALSTITPSTPNFSLGITNLNFGPVCINTTSAAGYFDFTPNNIPNGQQISVYLLDGFTYSTTIDGSYQNGLFLTNNNGATIRVYVKFTPTALQPYPALVDGVPGTINVNTANAGTLNVPVSGEGVNTPALATTGTSSAVDVTSATVAGQIMQGCSPVTAYGIRYSTTDGFADNEGTAIAGSNLADNAFSVNLTSLTACTTYYYKAYVTDAAGTHYGTQATFTTLPVGAPTATAATNIAQQSFTANWEAAPGATGYSLFVSTSADFSVAPETMITETFVNVPVLTSATSYLIREWTGVGSIAWTGYVLRSNYTISGAPSGQRAVVFGAAVNANASNKGADHAAGYIISDVISSTQGLQKVSFLVRKIGGLSSATSQFTVVALTGENFTIEVPVGIFDLGSTTGVNTPFESAPINITGDYKLKIYRSDSNNAQVALGNLQFGSVSIPVTGTSHTITGLDANTQYYYKVQANGENCSSADSETIPVRTLNFLTLVEAESDTAFGDVCVNMPQTKSFKFTAGGITDATLNFSAVNGYTYSTTADGEFTPTLQLTEVNNGEFTVYVRFTPTAVQAYNGTITIQGAAPYAQAVLWVSLTGAGILTPAVATVADATGITFTTANIAGTATVGNCAPIGSYGVEYSTTANFADGSGTQVAGTNIDAQGNFTVALADLEACSTYYFKAYVTDATGTYYSEQKTFSTPTLSAPVAGPGTGITQTAFTANWAAVEGATGYYLDVSTDPNFETVILTEDFSKIVAVAPENDSAITGNYDLYTLTPGWVGQSLYRTETGNARFGNSGNGGFINTPSLNLSANEGNITISFRAKYHSTDAKSITVHHFANGSSSSYSTVQTWPLTADYATYTTTLTGGTSNSKLRFFPIGTAPSRFHIDDIKVYYSMMLPGYENLPVTGLSHEVTGLVADTKYYYRVRPQGGNCSSANSETIEVHTLKYFTAGETDLAFGDVCTNATDTGSFKFTASGMTNAALNVSAVEGYTYSLTQDGEYTPTLNIPGFNGGETTVYVRFSPAAVQAYNGTIIVQGEAPYAGAVLEFEVTGAGIFTPTATTVQAATAVTMTSASIAATSTAGNCTPTTGYGIEYSTTNNFANGEGTQVIGANIDAEGNFTVLLENLLPCKTYYYKAYTTTSGSPAYSTQRFFTTTAIAAPVSLEASNFTGDAFTANWEPVANATGYKLDVSTSPTFGINAPGETTTETFENLPSSSAYNTRTWTGVNNINWEATQGRTDQDITGNAIAINTGGIVRNTTPITGGIKSLSFKYARVFSGNPTLQVYVNGVQRGSDLTPTETSASTFTISDLNVTGNVTIEIRNTSGSSNRRAVIDDLTFTTQDIQEPDFLPGYENLDVAGGSTTFADVSGLAAFTTYYYRVSAYSADCTTDESDVIEVSTKGLVTWKLVDGTAKWVPEFYADGTTPIVIDATIDTAIETDYTLGSGNNFNPKSVTLTSGIFTVTTGNTFRVENDIVNNANAVNFVVENNANLIQGKEQNNNHGAITVKRNSSPLFRQDYVMWSSPVAGQGLVSFSPYTAEGRYYGYDSTVDQYVDASGTFDLAKGYLIRMPNAGYVPGTAQHAGTINGTVSQYNNGVATMVYNGIFKGVPNSGEVTTTLPGAGYHLIGNPYPSPVNIQQFLAQNDQVINGTVYVWRKKNASAVPSAYVTMTRSGQYTDNGEPNTGLDPLGVLRTGQGFIVQTTDNNAGLQVTFNNAMRSSDTSNQFFRNANAAAQLPESHGVYLNLTNALGFYSQMYTGYIAGATNGRDNGIDAEYINDKPTVLSTVIGNEEFIIHGRPLPFNTENTEPLQLRTATAGEYKIEIDRTEGSFGNQDIYLKDNLLNVTHLLNDGGYTFSTDAGTFPNRFEIVYSPDGALGTDNPVADNNSIVIYKQDNVLKINSAKDEISDVTVFDIRGRKIYEATDVNATSTQTTGLQAQEQVLIVKVKTANGATVTKKVIF